MRGPETSLPGIGSLIARYELLERLGDAAHGVLYRARDTGNGRPALLHVLSKSQAGPRDAALRDGRIAASLQHPNIAAFLETGEDGSVRFLAMEHVSGRTLGSILETGALPWPEAARYAGQLAGALAAAHEAAILHRNLEPATVMVTETGDIKLLGFGLPAQEAGPYSSPEQAARRRVDTRSDIFSLGALLYAMVAGRGAFASAPADLRPAVPAGVPKALVRIVERCLREAPGRRYQSMEAVKTALEKALERPAARRLSPGRIIAAGAAAALLTVVAWKSGASRGARQPEARPLTADAGFTTDPAVSADGAMLAYASDRAGAGGLDLWVQPIAGGAARRLTAGAADERQPSFSPDGRRVAFRSEQDGAIYAVPIAGGEARLLAKEGWEPRFSPDGASLVYWTGALQSRAGAQVHVASLASGKSNPISGGFEDARSPIWSPDGAEVAFVGSRDGRMDWWVVPAAGGAPAALGAFDVFQMQGLAFLRDTRVPPSAWTATGFLFGARKGGGGANLWRAPYSPALHQIAGSAGRLTLGAARDTQPAETANGAVVFSRAAANFDIWSIPLDANTGRITGEPRRMVGGPDTDFQPSISLDGARMVYRSNRDGRGCVWLQDFETGKKTEHCTDAVNTLPPYISPGGKRAFYWAGRTVLVMDAGGGKEQFICRRCRPGPWLADEQRLLIQYNDGRVAVKDPGDPEGRDVLRSGKRKLEDPEPSPDARWIAFHTTDRRGAQIFVAPFRHTEPVLEKDWIPITDASAIDRNAHWSPGGNLLYFLSDRDGMRCIWAQRIDPRTGRPRGAAFPVHHFHHARLSLTQGANPSDVSMSVAKDRLVVSIVENTGNIWILGAER